MDAILFMGPKCRNIKYDFTTTIVIVNDSDWLSLGLRVTLFDLLSIIVFSDE